MAERIYPYQGCELIANTTARTGKDYTTFYVREDTVVATLTGGTEGGTDNATNYLTNFGLSGATLIKGDLITAPVGEVFKSLTLTSGSIIAYR